MTAQDIFSPDRIKALMKKVCNWQLDHFVAETKLVTGGTQPVSQTGWIRAAFYTGVMAAYLFLYTGERITTLVIPIPHLFRIPAWVYIVYSFGHDLLLGLLTEEVVETYGFSPFGTDVFAHLGGLVMGLMFIYLYLPPEALVDRRRGR